MARTTGYEYKKNRDWNPGIPGLEKVRDFNPGIQNRSGLTPLLSTYKVVSLRPIPVAPCRAAPDVLLSLSRPFLVS